MKFIVSLFLALVFVIGFVSPALSQSNSAATVEKRYEAEVIGIKDQETLTDGDVKREYQKAELMIQTGDRKGEKVIVENGKIPVINTLEVKKGDKVVVSVTKDQMGKDAYFITDYVRRDSLYLVFGIFLALTAIIAGKRGIASLFGMVISILIIFLVMLPQILQGRDPITVAILSSMVIIPITFYLSHGFNKKTTVAVIGTVIALVITGMLANFFVNLSYLSGFSSDDATFLQAAKTGVIQMQGLLLAGIIIGSLGVLDDITISQSSVVFKLKQTSNELNFWELYSKGMDIGRDHIASMVNTLVLVYTGAALPLLLLFTNSPRPFLEVINYELLAEEIVRTFVVSIGLILAVPIVTCIAALVCDQEVRRALREILKSLK